MSVPGEQFARLAGRLDVALLSTKLVVIIGVGTVGSQMASELASDGVGRLRLIDDDKLEESNLIRHALTRKYLGMNKAEALALYLTDEVPTLAAEALPRKIDNTVSANALDGLLSDADLIVAATDDREAQRRIARRALALDIPAVLPALYGDSGGEVFVQRSPRNPCFFCWDGFREQDERLRGVAALNADTLAVLQLAVQLSLGILDTRSEYADFMTGEPPERRPLQLFIQRRHAALERAPQRRRRDCSACAVGPARGQATTSTISRPIRQPTLGEEPAVVVPSARPIPALLWALVVAVIAIGIAVAISSGSNKSPSPSQVETRAQQPPSVQTSAGTSTEGTSTPAATSGHHIPRAPKPSRSIPTRASRSSSTCGTPAQCVEAGADAAAGEPSPNSAPTQPAAPPPVEAGGGSVTRKDSSPPAEATGGSSNSEAGESPVSAGE